MGDVLHVEYEVLDSSVAVLTRIADELDHAGARQEPVLLAVGHHGLARQLKEFTGNWERHRRLLVDEVRGVGQAVSNAAQAFWELDGALQQALVEADSSSQVLSVTLPVCPVPQSAAPVGVPAGDAR